MASIEHRDRRQQGIAVVFGLIWVLAMVYMVAYARAQDGMVLSDWVIDYRQGFVRRGFVGALLAPLAEVSRWPVWQLVPFVVMGLWAVFLYRYAQVLAGREKPFWYLLLLLSPAGVVFGVYLIGDVGRKELIHFALLAQFLWLLDRRRLNTAWTVAMGVLAFAAGLSHEMMIFYVGYFLVAAYWSGQSKTAWLGAGVIAMASALSVAGVGLFAQPFDGPAFCQSLLTDQGASASLCRGTVLWPLLTVSSSMRDTQAALTVFNYPLLYATALLLTFAPVALWMRRYDTAEFRRTLLPIGATVLVSLPLFLLAVDWGRFIQIHIVSSAMVLALRLPRRVRDGVTDSTLTAPHLFNWRNAWLRRGLAAATLGSALFWQMPLCCQPFMDYGLVGKIAIKLGLWERPIVLVGQ